MAGTTRALLLDLDNTLIDRDRAFLAWLGCLGTSVDTAAMIQLDRGGYGDKRALFTALGRALGVSPGRARAMHDEELPRFVELRDDAAALLDAFPGAKIVVTNGASLLQRAKVRAAGLDDRVDAVLVSSELGREKPDPCVFREALSRAGVSAGDALMVGDHPVTDIAGARAVGIAGRMLRTRWFEVPPGVTAIDRLTEVRW